MATKAIEPKIIIKIKARGKGVFPSSIILSVIMFPSQSFCTIAFLFPINVFPIM